MHDQSQFALLPIVGLQYLQGDFPVAFWTIEEHMYIYFKFDISAFDTYDIYNNFRSSVLKLYYILNVNK